MTTRSLIFTSMGDRPDVLSSWIGNNAEKNNYDIGTTLQLERIGYGIMIDKSTILFTHE